jgi:hypothetical protein
MLLTWLLTWLLALLLTLLTLLLCLGSHIRRRLLSLLNLLSLLLLLLPQHLSIQLGAVFHPTWHPLVSSHAVHATHPTSHPVHHPIDVTTGSCVHRTLRKSLSLMHRFRQSL